MAKKEESQDKQKQSASNKMGRPSKFDGIDLEKVRFFVEEKGFTDKELAIALDVTEQTINNWKKDHPDFFESLRDWKDIADRKVERSLYERACGFQHDDEEIKVVSLGQGQGSEVERVQVRKVYPPDSTSMIFWLKNRQPEKWKDKTDHQHGFEPENLAFIAKAAERAVKAKNDG